MKYYVKTEANERGHHVVHREDCQFLPKRDNRTALGDMARPETAVERARDVCEPVKGCHTCCA